MILNTAYIPAHWLATNVCLLGVGNQCIKFVSEVSRDKAGTCGLPGLSADRKLSSERKFEFLIRFAFIKFSVETTFKIRVLFRNSFRFDHYFFKSDSRKGN